MNQGICTKCEKPITSVQTENVSIDVGVTPKWKGFSFYCPNCKTVLSVCINPLLIRQDIENHVDKQLKDVGEDIVNRLSRQLKQFERLLRRS
jgi:hypothetical protein